MTGTIKIGYADKNKSAFKKVTASDRLKIFYLMNTRMPNRRSSTLQVMYTCNGLANQGNFVKLFITSKDASKSTIDEIFEFYGMEKSFQIQRLPTINWSRRLRTWSFVLLVVPYILANMLKYGKPDLVYIRGVAVAWTFLIASKFLQMSVFYETQELGSEVALKVHELVAIEGKKSLGFISRLKLAENFIFRNADGIIVGTDSLKQAIASLGIPESKVCVIPDGFDPRRFKIQRDSPRDKVGLGLVHESDLIGYIGHLYQWKGVDCLLEAMSLVVEDMPQTKLMIVGGLEDEPDIARLKELASKRGISKNVIFTGYVQPDQIPYYLTLPKILVIPTLDTVMGSYAMPMKIFEYMAAGKAIVATDLSAHKQILENRKTGLLVRAGDMKSMASALKILLKDKKLARTIAKNAKKRAYEEYTWEDRAKHIEVFLEEIIAHRETTPVGI